MASSIDASTSGAGGVITTADNTGILQLKTAGTTAVTVDASQNVGIGTTSPSTQLHVSGTNAVVNVTRSTKNFYLNPNYANGGSYATFESDLALATVVNGAERMRIDSSGRLMLGTTTTSISSLDAKYFDAADGQRLFSSRGSTAAREHIIFYNPNGDVGSIDTSGTSTSYNTSSDYRLKENIVPMVGALDVIAQLNPVTYTWKVDGSDGQGFIAHELQAVVPDCVTGEKDAIDEEGNPVYQGIDTSFLVATLTKAIQEQQELIKQLQADVAELKGV